MNIQNLLSQFNLATNKKGFLSSLLNPQQRQIINNLQGKSKQEQAEALAKYCNENNISKEQLNTIINMFGK